MRFTRYFLVMLCVLLAKEARAQHEFTNWCFGEDTVGFVNRYSNILLSFRNGNPVAYEFAHDQNLSSWGGVVNASISDATGNLLFSCNGNALYDAGGQLIPNGIDKTLNTITTTDPWSNLLNLQTTIITPAPGRPSCYYTFFWDGATASGRGASLHYAVVDMRFNGGRGGIVERSGPLIYTHTPHVTAVRHRNNRDFWILIRDEQSRGVVALPLTPQGMAAPVVSLTAEAQYVGSTELQPSPDGRHLATGGISVVGRTASSPGIAQGSVCLYEFDSNTGRVSHEQVLRRVDLARYGIDATGRPVLQDGAVLYASSFSPDGTKLYTTEASLRPVLPGSRRYTDIWQYDLTQPDVAATRYLVSNVPTPLPAAVDTTLKPFQLQLTPSGEIWTLMDHFLPWNPVSLRFSSMYVAAIRQPNVAGAGCGFVRRGFVFRPGQRPDIFPNLITNMLYAPATLNHEQACPEDSVQLWASSAGDPAGLRWDFGEPGSGATNTASGQYVAHRYTRGGSYPVRLTLADGRVLTQTVTVAAQAVDFTQENIFTPNGDGLNDVFIPVREALPGGRLRVFGRWGQAVFSTDDAARLRWDGAGAAGGEYFYLLEYADCAGQPRRRRGILTLVR